MPKYDVISFLSDMGTVDESVGVCKAIIFQQAPHVNIFDITHDVPQFDVRAGALALTRAIQFLPNGIVIAAVDPGSPRDQRYIAVDMAEGVLIGPDNGILAPASQLIGEPKRVIHISNPEFKIEAPGNVFAARDILAPAAGVIAAGTDMGELGPEIPLDQLVPGMLQLSRHDEGGAFLGEVWSLDRFGNVQLNITPEELDLQNVKLGDTVTLRVSEKDFMAKFVERYADLPIGQIGILVDSTGMISIVKNHDYAARELDVKDGKAVAILPQGTTITGRDVTVDVFSSSDGGGTSNQQTPTPQTQAGQVSPMQSGDLPQTPPPPPTPSSASIPTTTPQTESFGSMPATAPTVPNPAPTENPPSGATGQPPKPVIPEHRFVEAEFKSDPSLPPDPFATPPIPAPTENPPPPQNSQNLGDYVGGPSVYAPPSTPPTSQVPNPGSQENFGTPTRTQPSGSFSKTPPAPQAPRVDSPAPYFPPPVQENPPVATPEVSPTYDKSTGQTSAETQDTNRGGVPQNVFDLFKGNDEADDASTDEADQNPQP